MVTRAANTGLPQREVGFQRLEDALRMVMGEDEDAVRELMELLG